MIRKLACAAAAAFLITAAGCASDDAAPTTPSDDVAEFFQHDDEPDGMDCEPDDKAKKEIPDCGFYAGSGNTTFVWWSWVKAGRVTPPAGWDPRAEVAPYQQTRKATPAVTKAAKPKTTAKTAPRPSRSRRG